MRQMPGAAPLTAMAQENAVGQLAVGNAQLGLEPDSTLVAAKHKIGARAPLGT